MSDLWLTFEQLRDLTNWPPRTIHDKRRKGHLRSRLKSSGARARNGRREREYWVGSLPAALQQQFAAARLVAGSNESLALVPHANSDDTQLTLFVKPLAIPAEALRDLAPKQYTQAERRAQIIAPLVDFRQRTNGHKPVMRLQDGREIKSLEALAHYVADQHSVSRASVWRWYVRYTRCGFTALADENRADKGQSRFFARYPDLATLAQRKFLAESLTKELAYEAIVRECSGRGIPTPCYETVRSYLESRVPKPFAVMAREGEASFNEKCVPFLLRDLEQLAVNEVWVSDHNISDVFVWNDGLFTGIPFGNALRPWMTDHLDMRSRRADAVWNSTPSSGTISSLLKQSILKWGLPRTYLIDNGKDYQKIGRIDFSPEARGVLVRLGITPQFCTPYSPWAKLVESWHRTIRCRFDRLWPSYCGPTPDERPEQCDLLLKEHARVLKEGKPHLSPLPRATEFVRIARLWIEDWNATRRRKLGGESPDEIFERLLPPEQRRMLSPDDCLAELFWQRDRRRVLEGGCIQLNNARYEPADPTSGGALFMEIGRDVVVACDPCNLGEALAFDVNGQFLGRVRAQKLLVHGPVSRDDIKAGMRKRRLAVRVMRDYVKTLSEDNVTELDHLRRRAGVPAVCDLPRLPSGPEVLEPLKRAVGAATPMYSEDIARRFLENEGE